MFGHVKRIVPTPLKRSLRATFNVWMESHPLTGRVYKLEEGLVEGLAAAIVEKDQLAYKLSQLTEVVRCQQQWILTLMPDVLRPGDDALAAIGRVLAQHGINSADVNLAVSKNDVMFQYLVRAHHAKGQWLDAAFAEYVCSGLHMFQVLDTIVRRRFGSFAAVGSCLDFASGYGRLTRFLVRTVDPARIWVSDIKARTVQFQEEQFGVRGFASTANPEDLKIQERFDLVFVGSLFSHLPENAFEAWLRRLWELLTPTGLLVFTANDVSQLGDSTTNGHVFLSLNEECDARTEDGLLDTAQYGSMYVTSEFVRELANRLPPIQARHCDRYQRAMWGVQDVYVLARDNASIGELTLPVQESI